MRRKRTGRKGDVIEASSKPVKMRAGLLRVRSGGLQPGLFPYGVNVRCFRRLRVLAGRMSGRYFPQQVIARKRDGHALSADEIAAFVRGATDGSWADYQLSALLMAIFLRGMETDEVAA